MRSIFKFFTILAMGILLCAMTSCASISEKGAKGSAPTAQKDSTSYKAVAALGNQFVLDSPTAVYYRMTDEFKLSISEDKFCETWKSLTNEFGACTKVAEPKLLRDGSNQIYALDIDFEKGKYRAEVIITKDTINPMKITFTDDLKTKAKEPSKLSDAELAEWKAEADKFTDAEFDISAALLEPSLGELCKDYFKIGCGITGASSNVFAIKSPEFMEIVKKHFTSMTATNMMKPSYLLHQNKSMTNAKNGNEEPVLDFTPIDPFLKWAKENNVPVRGHTLVWHTQIPDWFFLEGYRNGAPVVDKETMKFRMESYIKQYLTYVQTNYPGVVYCWDVVNEAVDPSGDHSVSWSARIMNDKYENMWYKTLGPDYVELAFTYARKYADPDVVLVYNDYGCIDRTKRQLIYNLVMELKEKDLIDGIGLQGYWDLRNPSLRDIKDAIELYAQTGLEIMFTEWSINSPDESPENMALQAERYASTFRLLQSLDTQGGGPANITCVSFFGVMNHYMYSKGDKTNCRPFDENLQPNAMFYAVKETFDDFYR